MKKAINKTEMAAIIRGLVVESCLEKGKLLALEIEDCFNWLRDVCITNFINEVKEIPNRARQVELIQAGVLRTSRLSVEYSYWEANHPTGSTPCWMKEPFGKQTLNITHARSDTMRAHDHALWATILTQVPGLDKHLTQQHFQYNFPSLQMGTSFADVPASSMPSIIHMMKDVPSGEGPTEVHKYNHTLCAIHCSIKKTLDQIFNMMLDASTLRDQLQQAMAAIKTPDDMERLFPEAVKHFPDTVKRAPKTKQVADPAFINELRAKMAAGLPT